MAILSSDRCFGRDLAVAMGLDPSVVRSIDIHVEAGSLVVVDVSVFATADQAERIASAVTSRRFVEVNHDDE